MVSRDKRLPLDKWNTSGLQENVSGTHFSAVGSSRNHYQRIHHSMTPGDTGSVPVLVQELLSQEMKINIGAQFQCQHLQEGR